MITKTLTRKGNVGKKKGYCFEVYYNNSEYPNFISALYKTIKEIKNQLCRYIKTGDFDFYGNAE